MSVQPQANTANYSAVERDAYILGFGEGAGQMVKEVESLKTSNRNLMFITSATLVYVNRRQIIALADCAIENVQKTIQERKEKKNR